MTAEDAEECVIRPMRVSFPAPTHVRGNSAATEMLLAVYRKALARFDRAALEQGWQKAAAENDLWCWPKVAELVRACASFGPCRPAVADDRVEQAEAMVDAYWKQFAKSTTALRANEGGWQQELRAYVCAAARVQAQLVLGRQSVGYSSAILFPWHPRDPQVEEEFFTDARRQAATGKIAVRVPHRLVESWKAQVASSESVGREPGR